MVHSDSECVLGYLLHLTHYDPVWATRKPEEQRCSFEVATAIIDKLAECGFNTLLVGVSDGVVYGSHPEFTRHYSIPMDELRRLGDYARTCGLELIPKLNFSRSEINMHNHWMRAPGEEWHEHFDDEIYWRTAFECIDEVIDALKPERHFHIGMDEDHQRSYSQFAEAILCLHEGLHKRGLKTVVWSDTALDYASGDIYREKYDFALPRIPTDIVSIIWNYWDVPSKAFARVADMGMSFWGAPGWKDADLLMKFGTELVANNGSGLVMTRWTNCIEENREELLGQIETHSHAYRRTRDLYQRR